MGRLIFGGLIILLLGSLQMPSATGSTGGNPGRGDILGTAEYDHIDILGKTSTKTMKKSRESKSYQPVCVTPPAATQIGKCVSTRTLCPNARASEAVWVMTAPSGDPTAEDWVNTGRINCLASRSATPAVVINAEQFRRLRIPAPHIITQPNPAVRPTLINIDTNFLTEKKSVVLPTTVLGQPIRVRATPASYLWTYGDGQQMRTTNPGDLYPNIQTPHVYLQPGNYTVQLQTTFTGEYSVSGGPWQPIQGTATTTSPTTTITAEEKRAVLIS